VAVSQITSEAQQALLKLFEEPQEGAIFLLLAPHGSIIPTLRSRFLDYPWKPQESVFQSAGAFLAASQKTRGAEIVKLLKDEDGLRERVRDFLNALEQALYPMLQKSSGKKEIREGLEDIARIRSYANDRSPSLKMLLEHLALSLPMLS
jgi:DNA polymerase III delta prime subunit